jgi:hypothetical protein
MGKIIVMFKRNLEDAIKVTKEPRSFDEDFFDFTDRIVPWTTVYRIFFLTDLIKKTQFMLGVGQKNLRNYRVNGKRMEFSNNGPAYKVGVSYWLDNGSLIHETKNITINVEDGIRGNSFSFKREGKGYRMDFDELSTSVFFDDSRARTDYVKFNAGITPFFRHNKYIPFEGAIMGEDVSKGLAFIQKVCLNMPFIPWRWGRVFFEGGAHFDFYEPKILYPLFKSINFEAEGERLEFKLNQSISFKDSIWKINGTSPVGETLEASIRSINNVKQTFETPKTRFEYNEMPSKLESLSIKRYGQEIYSMNSLGESVANCEDAYYTRINPLSKW